MEAFYGDFRTSDTEDYDCAYDTSDPFTGESMGRQLPHSDLVLSIQLEQVSHHHAIVTANVGRQISIVILVASLFALIFLHLSHITAIAFAVSMVASVTAICVSTKRSWREEPSIKTVRTPDDGAMWRLLLAIENGRLQLVQRRCDDLVKLSASMPDDAASSEAVNTITRDLRGLVTAYKAAYEFADADQREALTADLIASVENIGTYASRQHEVLLRARLDNFQTHRRFIAGKTADGPALLTT